MPRFLTPSPFPLFFYPRETADRDARFYNSPIQVLPSGASSRPGEGHWHRICPLTTSQPYWQFAMEHVRAPGKSVTGWLREAEGKCFFLTWHWINSEDKKASIIQQSKDRRKQRDRKTLLHQGSRRLRSKPALLSSGEIFNALQKVKDKYKTSSHTDCLETFPVTKKSAGLR